MIQPEQVDLVYVGLNNRVAALDRSTGELRWEWKAPKGTTYCTVLVDGDCVFAGVYGYVYCLDARTGAMRWSNPMSGFGVGVTSLATQRASQDGNAQGAASAAASSSAAAAAAASVAATTAATST